MPLSLADTPISNAELSPIQKQVIDATREMFGRAVSGAPAGSEITDSYIRIVDDKEKLPKSGPLQDCEFGMILVLARDWCQGGYIESEFFNSLRFEQVVLLLVRRAVDRVLEIDKSKSRVDEGGEGTKKADGSLTAFFTAEPYTEHKKNTNKRFEQYSANLDAAMISIAFLAPAVAQYNEQLAKHNYRHPGLPDWIQTLRDAALYVIRDGLNYAVDCQILVGNKCQGFTSDPSTREEHPTDGGFADATETDRLFFTWTACETIKDMTEWRDSYLDQPSSTPPPPSAVAELKSLIKQLEDALLQAATWCKSSFYKRFEEFEVPKTRELVQLGWAAEREEQVKQMERDVLHVYHLSQYAAIRSLAPEGVTLDEVRIIVDKLDTLVKTSIIESELDASKDDALFRTLTRYYSLGSSNPNFYQDDAWYPLVVRSLSGLLSRTLRGFERRSLRSDVDALTNAFEDSLKFHISNLLKRRPEGGTEGPDGKLWSFAIDSPYVLYATQRTVFALMTYGDFLVEVARFRTGGGGGKPGLRQELSLRAAQKLADTLFGPIIDDLLQFVPAPPSTVAPATNDGLAASLPEEPWAAGTICELVARFTNDFREVRFANTLWQKANALIHVHDTVVNSPITRPISENDRSPLAACHRVVDEIYLVDPVGQKLKQSTWETEAVTQILFEHLFREYMAPPNGSLEAVLASEKPNNLWKLIERATRAQDSFKKK